MEPQHTQPHTEEQSTQPPVHTEVHEALHGLEAVLAPLFDNAPHLPEKARNVLVDIAPWIALVFGILGVASLLTGGMLMALMTVFTAGFALLYFVHTLIPVVFSAIGIVLLLMAYPGLKERSKRGWNLVFYSQVVQVLGGLLAILTGAISMLVGTVVGALIGFWLLFEVRSHYHE